MFVYQESTIEYHKRNVKSVFYDKNVKKIYWISKCDIKRNMKLGVSHPNIILAQRSA